jgi:undecaprenyl diphosphate synthase
MTLLERSIERELPELMERNVRFRAIGRPDGVPPRVAAGIRRLMDTTAGNTGLTLLMAFNYGGRDEMVDAVRALARQVQTGALRPEDIDEVRVSRALYTDGVPDPDLLIRTSGEQRLSNFLLWQIAYTELWMTPILWPDFGAREFCVAVAEFQQRNRRFGRV